MPFATVALLSRQFGVSERTAKILSVSERTIRDWLSRIDKDTKAARDKKIFGMWLSCHTHEEVAESVGLTRPEITKSVPNGKFAEWNQISDSDRHAANHEIDFAVPNFNVWKFKEKSNDVGHFGNSEQAILDRLPQLARRRLAPPHVCVVT